MPVYALVDPRTKATRYVGLSKEPTARLRQHLAHAHSERLRDWIGELLAAGLEPELRLLDGSTEREWILRLAPDLNIRPGFDPALVTDEKRVNLRSTESEMEAWREVAESEHLDLTTWIRRLAWQAVEKWWASRGAKRKGSK